MRRAVDAQSNEVQHAHAVREVRSDRIHAVPAAAGGRVDPMNRVTTNRAETVAELTARALVARQPASAAQRHALTHQYAALNLEFAQLCDRSRRLLHDERLTGASARLAEAAEAGGDVARLISGELARFDDLDATIVAPAVIGELFDECVSRLAALDSQQRLLDDCAAYAADLHQITRQLLSKTHVSPAQLQNLARRILLDVQDLPPAELLPEPGLSIENCLAPREKKCEPAVYAKGIEAARLLAFAAPRLFAWGDRTELLVIAALIHDIGLLPLEERAGADPTAYRKHPLIGAALAAAVIDYAVDLPSIVAQHHERCDGTGFPRGERSARLSAPSRFLALAGRFVELMQDETPRLRAGSPAAFETADTAFGKSDGLIAFPDEESCRKQWHHQGDQHATAARRLRREAAQGELDLPLTAAFLDQLGFGELDEERPPLGRHFQLGRFGEKRFRIDGAEPTPRPGVSKTAGRLGSRREAAREQ